MSRDRDTKYDEESEEQSRKPRPVSAVNTEDTRGEKRGDLDAFEEEVERAHYLHFWADIHPNIITPGDLKDFQREIRRIKERTQRVDYLETELAKFDPEADPPSDADLHPETNEPLNEYEALKLQIDELLEGYAEAEVTLERIWLPIIAEHNLERGGKLIIIDSNSDPTKLARQIPIRIMRGLTDDMTRIILNEAVPKKPRRSNKRTRTGSRGRR